jgi:hypothetical protein
MALAAKPGEATGKRMSIVDAKLSTTHIGAPEHDPTESLQVKGVHGTRPVVANQPLTSDWSMLHMPRIGDRCSRSRQCPA